MPDDADDPEKRYDHTHPLFNRGEVPLTTNVTIDEVVSEVAASLDERTSAFVTANDIMKHLVAKELRRMAPRSGSDTAETKRRLSKGVMVESVPKVIETLKDEGYVVGSVGGRPRVYPNPETLQPKRTAAETTEDNPPHQDEIL